jgi:hypothetical protein
MKAEGGDKMIVQILEAIRWIGFSRKFLFMRITGISLFHESFGVITMFDARAGCMAHTIFSSDIGPNGFNKSAGLVSPATYPNREGFTDFA